MPLPAAVGLPVLYRAGITHWLASLTTAPAQAPVSPPLAAPSTDERGTGGEPLVSVLASLVQAYLAEQREWPHA